MDFDLPPDHELIRRTVREFAEGEIAPVAEALDREKRFPYEIVAKLGELGLMGIPFPEEVGGAGGDTLAYTLAVEELARVDSSVAITMCAHTSLGTQPIHVFGSREQQEEWLPALTAGRKLGAFGLTEPEAGSDAGNVRTRARLEGGEWVIDGAKQFITNAGTDISGLVCITARTGDDEISNLIVPNGTPGYTQGAPYRKMGWNASDTRPLSFDGCRVPAENLLGPRGAGFKQFLRILDIGRIGVAAMGVGLAQGALDQALAYARERRAFGQPISKFQAIQAQARRHGDGDRGGAAAHLQGREAEGRRPRLHADGGPGQAEDRTARGALRRGGRPDPRRLRLHRGVPGVPLLPRREDPHDRRGDRRGAAARHRAGAGSVGRCGRFALWAALFAAYAATLGVDAGGGAQYAVEERRHLVAADALAGGSLDLSPAYARPDDERRVEGEADDAATDAATTDAAGGFAGRRPLATDGEVVGGRLVEPRGIGFPLLIAPAFAVGGAKLVEVLLAAVAAVAFVLGAALARRVVPDPWATWAALAAGLSPPALAHATAVLPALTAGGLLAGAALCALAVRQRPLMRTAFGGAVLLALLPWLDPWLLVPAAPIAVLLARWTARRGRVAVALGTVEVQLASLVFYASLNSRVYGGLTPLAVADEPVTGAASVGDYVARLPRLATMWLDAEVGLLRWAPIVALAFLGLWLLWRSRRQRLARLAAERRDAEHAAFLALVVCAGQVLLAAFTARSLSGYPGTHLVAALPCAVAPIAWGLRRAPRAGALLAALTTTFSAWVALTGDGWLR